MQLTDTIQDQYGPPLDVISNALRGFIIAKPGHILRVADFSSVEARGVAWLAGAEKMLEVFRTGASVYCLAASDIYGREIVKGRDDAERQIGKVTILACGYQGAVGAFQAMAKGYGVVVPDAEALKIVKAWRGKNPEIVDYWAEVEKAAIDAVRAGAKGTVFKAGAPGREVRFGMRGSFLVCRLPSGRRLYYPYPKLVSYVWIKKPAVKVQATGDDGAPLELLVTDAQSKRVPAWELSRWIARGWTQNGEPGPALHYQYTDPETKRWVEGPTYGGSLVENITQAICRDLLVAGMLRLSQWGYDIIMHVHDEVVTETPEDFGSTEEIEAILAEVPTWAQGFPLGAEGYSAKRYKKG